MSRTQNKIVVRHLYKIFGHHSQSALEKLQHGWDKTRIHKETGAVVGVHDVSFEVREGEIFVLMGLSGSGKSTLIRLINRLISPTSGEVHIDSRDIIHMKHHALVDLRRREMSMVFQSFALMPNRNVLQNAAFGLEIAGVKRQEREARARDVLDQVGLHGFYDKKIDELSGGMRQRVGLARALAVDPSLIIMDEAFSALDPLIRREMQDILLRLQREHRRTVLFVSHDIEEALRIGNRIAIMEGGHMVQIGTPEELIAHPANDYVRHFFSTVNTTRFMQAHQLADNSIPVYQYKQLENAPDKLLEEMKTQHFRQAFIVDEAHHLLGTLLPDQPLSSPGQNNIHTTPSHDGLHTSVSAIAHDEPISNVIDQLRTHQIALPVVNPAGIYTGAITPMNVLLRLGETL